MKSIIAIVILFSISVNSQIKVENLTNISLFKIYNEGDDFPCNSFVKGQLANIAVRKIENCDNLVLELINLKENLKKKKYRGSCCLDGTIGCYSIENMLVYQYNKHIDTLYFNRENDILTIIDYTTKKEYIDDENIIINTVNKNKVLKKFFETNLDKLFYSYVYKSKTDIIKVEEVKLNDFSIYGSNIDEIERVVNGFESIYTEQDKFNYYKKNIRCITFSTNSGNEFYFHENEPINCLSIKFLEVNPEEQENLKPFKIQGIKVGDNEALLIKKYPHSTEFIEIQKEFFKDKNNNYEVHVEFDDKKGKILFLMNEGKVKEINIYFKYLSN